jgi:hypothetical protein
VTNDFPRGYAVAVGEGEGGEFVIERPFTPVKWGLPHRLGIPPAIVRFASMAA